jgi:CMP-N-acetylneuraminic acid synthetase
MVKYDLIAVIPARLGSSRVKRKVLQDISPGVSLLKNKIDQLAKVLPKRNIIVNTESREIAQHVEKEGVNIHFRDPFYADAHKATWSELIVHVVTPIDAKHVAWAPCVCPFFDETEFMESFNNYEENVIHGKYDSLVSVTSLRSYIWSDTKALNYSPNKDCTMSQGLPAWYEVTNGNYMASKELMLSRAYVLGEKPFLDIRSQKCKIDIDTATDLSIARAFSQINKK